VFRLLFCNHYQADPKNIKKKENTVAISGGDLGLCTLLYKTYDTHNIYDTNNTIVGLKICNYKILNDWIVATVV
jgi:hypothetical protein